jgi:NTE family protein
MSDIHEIMKAKSGICFSGGGVLGYGHAGVVDRLAELGFLDNITHVTGSSVGSIFSTAMACNASNDYIKTTTKTMDPSMFKDGGCVLSQIIRLLVKGGLHKGNNVWKFAKKIVKDLTGSEDTTMKEAYDKFGITNTIAVYSLRYRETRYINYITQPQAKLADAIRASSSIAIFYKPFKTKLLSRPDEKGNRKLETDYLGDGGTANNVPSNVLREQGLSGGQIINIIFLGTKDKKEYDLELNGGLYDHGLPRIPTGLIGAYIDGLRDEAMKRHVHKEDWKLTIKIDTGDIKVSDFDLSEEKRIFLYENGRKAVDQYLIEAQELLDRGEYPL